MGAKAREGAKAMSLRLYYWIFSMRVSEEERSVRDGVVVFRIITVDFRFLGILPEANMKSNKPNEQFHFK